jgi:hypothetical protein
LRRAEANARRAAGDERDPPVESICIHDIFQN